MGILPLGEYSHYCRHVASSSSASSPSKLPYTPPRTLLGYKINKTSFISSLRNPSHAHGWAQRTRGAHTRRTRICVTIRWRAGCAGGGATRVAKRGVASVGIPRPPVRDVRQLVGRRGPEKGK